MIFDLLCFWVLLKQSILISFQSTSSVNEHCYLSAFYLSSFLNNAYLSMPVFEARLLFQCVSIVLVISFSFVLHQRFSFLYVSGLNAQHIS